MTPLSPRMPPFHMPFGNNRTMISQGVIQRPYNAFAVRVLDSEPPEPGRSSTRGGGLGVGTRKVVPATQTNEGALCIEMRIKLYPYGAMSKVLDKLANVRFRRIFPAQRTRGGGGSRFRMGRSMYDQHHTPVCTNPILCTSKVPTYCVNELCFADEGCYHFPDRYSGARATVGCGGDLLSRSGRPGRGREIAAKAPVQWQC